jgi:hypothetical protein
MKSRYGMPILLCLLISFCTGCANWNIRKHPDFKSRQPNINVMGMLPSQVEVYKLTFQGDKVMMYDLLPPIEKQLTEEITKALTKRGYTVQQLDLESDTIANSTELKNNLHTVKELVEKDLKEYSKKWFPGSKGFNYNVGPEINTLADAYKSDVLVLAKATGIKKTGGEIAKDWAKTILIAAASLGNAVIIYDSAITLVQMVVIDGNTGDILWKAENNLGKTGFDIDKEKKFRKLVRQMASKFPKAYTLTSKSTAQATHSTDTSTAAISH